MNEPLPDDDPNSATRKLGETFATVIGQKEWSLDNSEALLQGKIEEVEVPELPVPIDILPIPAAKSKSWLPPEEEIPPTPRQILEALLFVADQPLEIEAICEVIRGISPPTVLEEIAQLNRLYEKQYRPYRIVPRKTGYRMELLPQFKEVEQKLNEQNRELQLPQPALEILSLIAYRQPVEKSDIDRIRGMETGMILRQLMKFGLVSSLNKVAEGQRSAIFSTTAKFLDMFGLRSLDDLPKMGEPERR
ncbi:SMC-Scp complex subunit ScpB [Telmatocola sphagniphila]|uniref:SMC-Scp complex subunit ScpB n=1 Tax=Telmatocola sphagniphila TaxID=1123043 RepID=A0A8E6EYL7_9BACT|nr:SMC-Scp complex subunit ScpB [Telmatocola sphagniphila]QVL32501.1 SMC-Scp complex subunit ScpB [Telmatocola sphagniphila]